LPFTINFIDIAFFPELIRHRYRPAAAAAAGVWVAVAGAMVAFIAFVAKAVTEQVLLLRVNNVLHKNHTPCFNVVTAHEDAHEDTQDITHADTQDVAQDIAHDVTHDITQDSDCIEPRIWCRNRCSYCSNSN
jgi:hypothetical protein